MSTRELHEVVAIYVFGWRWLAYQGTPVRGHADYRTGCVVRQLFPPIDELSPQWQKHLDGMDWHFADGSEPLDYSYCSSCGPHQTPTMFDDSAILPHMRKLKKTQPEVWERFVKALPPAHRLTATSFSRAALKAFGHSPKSSPFAAALNTTFVIGEAK